MASNQVTVDARNINAEMTVHIHFKKFWFVRVGVWFIRLGCMIAGFSYHEVALEK